MSSWNGAGSGEEARGRSGGADARGRSGGRPPLHRPLIAFLLTLFSTGDAS